MVSALLFGAIIHSEVYPARCFRNAPDVPLGLTQDQRKQLAALVEAGPTRKKDGVARWRRVALKKKTESLFGVEMNERTVGKHLAALAYRKLSVRPQHPKSDP